MVGLEDSVLSFTAVWLHDVWECLTLGMRKSIVPVGIGVFYILKWHEKVHIRVLRKCPDIPYPRVITDVLSLRTPWKTSGFTEPDWGSLRQINQTLHDGPTTLKILNTPGSTLRDRIPESLTNRLEERNLFGFETPLFLHVRNFLRWDLLVFWIYLILSSTDKFF